MNTLLVSYDLNYPDQNYNNLLEYIGSLDHCHPLESFWLVATSKSYTEFRDELSRFIDSNDKLIVINVSGDATAWRNLDIKDSTWIKANL